MELCAAMRLEDSNPACNKILPSKIEVKALLGLVLALQG